MNNNDLCTNKIPDSVIIKSQQIEIGKLKSYIDELLYKNNLKEINVNNEKLRSLRVEVRELKEERDEIMKEVLLLGKRIDLKCQNPNFNCDHIGEDRGCTFKGLCCLQGIK